MKHLAHIYLLLALPALLGLGTGCGGRSPGVRWHEGDLDSALRTAAQEDRVVLVDVYATWCPPCRALDDQIWSAASGEALTRDLVAWKVDFDQEPGQEIKRRYRILGLPTTLFLRPDGSEIDRIEGFADAQEFLAEARRYADGESRLAGARRAVEEDPDDAPARVTLGRLLLVRGEEQEGRALLASAAASGDAEAASEALFLLGRYYTRAAERPDEGAVWWRRLHREHPESRYAGGALWWLLKSWDAAGTLEAGLQELRGGTLLQDPDDYGTAADYLRSLDRDEEAEALVRQGLQAHPDSESLAALLEDDAPES